MKKTVSFFLVVLLFTACGNKPLPFPNRVTECPASMIPLTARPLRDKEQGIKLEATYCALEQDGNTVTLKLSLLYTDEIHPGALVDVLYRRYRALRYGRVQDLESFDVVLNCVGPLCELRHIDFDNTYSGKQKFQEKDITHFTRKVLGKELTFQKGRPLIYVNTWNHLFSEKDQNPKLEKLIETPPIARRATREELDSYYEN